MTLTVIIKLENSLLNAGESERLMELTASRRGGHQLVKKITRRKGTVILRWRRDLETWKGETLLSGTLVGRVVLSRGGAQPFSATPRGTECRDTLQKATLSSSNLQRETGRSRGQTLREGKKRGGNQVQKEQKKLRRRTEL